MNWNSLFCWNSTYSLFLSGFSWGATPHGSITRIDAQKKYITKRACNNPQRVIKNFVRSPKDGLSYFVTRVTLIYLFLLIIPFYYHIVKTNAIKSNLLLPV